MNITRSLSANTGGGKKSICFPSFSEKKIIERARRYARARWAAPLDNLSPISRNIVIHTFSEIGLPQSQIASLLGCSKSTVSRLSRITAFNSLHNNRFKKQVQNFTSFIKSPYYEKIE